MAGFLQARLKLYQQRHQRLPNHLCWRFQYTKVIYRFLSHVQGRRWPLPAQPDLELEEYDRHLTERGIIRKTRLDYLLHVRMFLGYLRGKSIAVETIQLKDVAAYFRVALRMIRKRKPNRTKVVSYWQRISRRSVCSFLRFRLGEWPPDPAGPLVNRFEAHLKEARYAPRVIGRYLWAVRVFLAYIERNGIELEAVRPSDIAAFLGIKWEEYCRSHRRPPMHERQWRCRFAGPVHDLLRMLDPKWPPPEPPASAGERRQSCLCEGYERWLTDVCGLSTETLRKNGDAARMFVRWLDDHGHLASLRRLSVSQIDEYFAWRLPRLRRATRQGVCSCMRSFVRYLYGVKLIGKNLEPAVTGPSKYQFEDIPRAFTEQQVKAVVAATRRDRSATGLRDYAMLLMLATYGMRAGELIRLRLDDVDWRAERFRIRQSKTHIESCLPLVKTVGEALLAYLQHGRPQTDRREVFLKIRAPLGPLSSSGSLSSVVHRRLLEAGIEVKGRHGAHAFRFARALSLMRGAVSLKWVGDLLGHQSEKSTHTYIRLATEDLRALSLEVPGRKK